MKKTALLIVAALATALSVSAYEQMLVEGRIWEHTERYGYEPRELYSLEIGEASKKFGKMSSPVISLESGDTIAFLREEPG
ncbi:MAG: hypothetical protein U0L83_02735 [Muribaculaceae bacterium]|nr:hypothetical protein [Muribaculaceae bacterium]